MRKRLSCCLLTLMVAASPAGAVSQYGRMIGGSHVDLADPDAALERMAAASTPQQGRNDRRLPRKTTDILRNDPYLREAFAGVGHR